MKTFLKDIWERIINWKTTSIGIFLGIGIFAFLYYVLNQKIATFGEINVILLPLTTIIIGALMRDTPTPPNLPPTI